MIDNGRSHDFGGLGFTSSKSRDHNWVQVSRNDEESSNAGDSKSSNIDVMMASAVATGSTISGSAASMKFMASHVRAPGSKNYIQRSAKDLKLQAKESFQSDESAKQTYSTATRPILTITSKIVNSNPITFKPQKDKRQKLDGIPISMESVPVILQHPSSCLIYQKSNIIESLYATHQQQNILRPPVVIVSKNPEVGKSGDIAGERDDNSNHENVFRLESAIASASVGVRVFHGLNQVPNLSEEEGQAADWVGHVMSSTSALIELSVENSKKHDEMSPDSAGVSLESECPRSKWGGGPLDNPEVMFSAPGINTETSVRPYDCSNSYRDQVMNTPSRSRLPSIPSAQITALTAVRSRPTSLIKKNSASSFVDWPVADQRRPGK